MKKISAQLNKAGSHYLVKYLASKKTYYDLNILLVFEIHIYRKYVSFQV